LKKAITTRHKANPSRPFFRGAVVGAESNSGVDVPYRRCSFEKPLSSNRLPNSFRDGVLARALGPLAVVLRADAPSRRGTTPAADFCRPVRLDRSTLGPDSGTRSRSPEVSSTAFRTQPPNLQPVPLLDMGFAVTCPLARHRMPQIPFLYIGSYVYSKLLSDPASRRRPCASPLLHFHQVVEGLSPPSCQTCSAHMRKPARDRRPASALRGESGTAQDPRRPERGDAPRYRV
jgi:hypothetical protein